ncbi:MAG: DUF4238 domain-containing protein [Cognatishimia sp.]|nr:DUF4238 domain-containing protein [Cognatishimia sp.]
MSKVKRQHYVPQFLLNKFADEQGKLSVYLRGKGLSRQARPDGMAFQRYYNAAKNDAGEIDTQTIEKELSQIEGAGSAVVQSLLDGATISSEARDHFSIFLTSQDFRSPRRRQEFADMLLGIEHHGFDHGTVSSVEKYIQAVTAASERDGELDVSRISHESELTIEDDGTVAVSFEATIRALSAAKSFAQVVANMDWHLFHAPRGHRFILSDSPVQLYEDPKTLKEFSGPAYWRPGSHVALPLSSTVCFVASHKSNSSAFQLPIGVQKREAKGSDVRFFNHLQIAGCLRELYATSDFAWLSKISSELPPYESPLSFLPRTMGEDRQSVKTRR